MPPKRSSHLRTQQRAEDLADILPFTKQVEELERTLHAPPLKSGNGGGTFGGMDDDRLKGIDGRLTAIEGEQRTHLRWSLTIALALAALIATGTTFLMTRIDRVEDRLTRLETNVNELPAKLTTSLAQLNQTLLQAVTASKQAPPQVIVVPREPAIGPNNTK
jgi:hypothetical protein